VNTHHQWDFLLRKYLTTAQNVPLFHNINQSYSLLHNYTTFKERKNNQTVEPSKTGICRSPPFASQKLAPSAKV